MPQTNRTVGGVLGGLLGLVALSAVAGLLITATVTPVVAVASATTKQAIDLFEDLPAYMNVSEPIQPYRILADDGNGGHKVLATFYDQNREPLTYDEVPVVIIDAILSSEDKTFFEHAGINLGATARALYENVTDASSRGASTITQQFVKNALIQECEQGVTPGVEDYWEQIEKCWWDNASGSGAQGVDRKVKELRRALQIEKEFSKDQILLGYLNIASFGGQVYGIQAASKYYFGVPVDKLTIAQAATLAGVVQEPNKFRIDRPDSEANGESNGYKLTKDRRDYVLNQMALNGKITDAQRDEALAEDIVPNITRVQTGCSAAGADAYFCKYVQEALEKDAVFVGDTEESRQAHKSFLRLGGFDVYTTLDPGVQSAATASMAERTPTSREDMHFGAAATTLESGTGRILALAQNTIFDETPAAEDSPDRTSLVYAADFAHGGSGGFAVGSTYKLFTLIDWLEKGRSINEVIDGRRRTFTSYQCNGARHSNNDLIRNYGDGGGGAGYTGTITRFTRDSLNTGYLAMATQLDHCEINEVASRMGANYATGEPATSLKIGNRVLEDTAVMFDILGSKTIAPIDMAGAYATVANEGVYCKPHAIDRIVTRSGEELFKFEPECEQVIAPEVAATAIEALRSVMVSGGTGTRANPGDGTPLFGKTGTNEGYSTMMIASSTETTTAAWVGNTKQWQVDEDRWEWVNLPRRYHNGTQLNDIRYYLVRDIQRAANAEYGGERFPAADKHLTRRVLTDLPSVLGLSIDEATEVLKDAGFSVRVGDPVDSDLAAGLVGAQDPGAGRVPGGTLVTISPSNGQALRIPDLQGEDPAGAVAALMNLGYTQATLGTCTSDSDADSSWVTGTRPAAGEVANKNTRVRVDYRAPSC